MAIHTQRLRTSDVVSESLIRFDDLLLSKEVLEGLSEAGFTRPSPIQIKAIPVARTRQGIIIFMALDMIVQAKSGTGKTIIFAVASLEILSEQLLPQVLIITPTREIALQIHSVLLKIGQRKPSLFAQPFIGGLPLGKDIQRLSPCNVVVGTPGRIKQLIDDGHLNTSCLSLFVVDEADKVFEKGALEEATMSIFNALPDEKQFMAFSATYTPQLVEKITALMKNPQHVLTSQENVTLQGVRQYWLALEPNDVNLTTGLSFHWKTQQLIRILSKISFYQCIVFCNNQMRSKTLANKLEVLGWPSTFISAQLRQKERNSIMTRLREFKIRVLVSTDLISRGLDIERINLIVNLDIPTDAETYLHRVGRTGRFGTYGVAINLLTDKEKEILFKFGSNYQCALDPLPDELSPELYHYELPSEQEQKQLEGMELWRIQCEKKAREIIFFEDNGCLMGQEDNYNDLSSSMEGNNWAPEPTSPDEKCKKKKGLKHLYGGCSVKQQNTAKIKYYPPNPPPPPNMPNYYYHEYINYIQMSYLPVLKKAIIKNM